MRRIERTGSFKRDFKRIRATPRHRDIVGLLPEVVELLVTDSPLPERYRDHVLSGDWKDHRDCHIKPDLVLIYREPDPDVLQLGVVSPNPRKFRQPKFSPATMGGTPLANSFLADSILTIGRSGQCLP